jgi:hypothetical protein
VADDTKMLTCSKNLNTRRRTGNNFSRTK